MRLTATVVGGACSEGAKYFHRVDGRVATFFIFNHARAHHDAPPHETLFRCGLRLRLGVPCFSIGETIEKKMSLNTHRTSSPRALAVSG